MKRLLVVQPYLAAYRRAFWAETIEGLARRGVECHLALGSADDSQVARKDTVDFPGTIPTLAKSKRMFGANIRWQASWRHWADYDGLVLEASGSLLDTSAALALSRKPVALWGHIASFTRPRNAVDRHIETWQLRRASSVLAYTPRGGQVARDAGVDPRRITVLNNTIDTMSLIELVDQMSRTRADEILGTWGWSRQFTACYIGGLDLSKRVDWLVATLDRIWEANQDFRLIIGGRGDGEDLLRPAVARGQVKHIGRATDREKAALAHVANFIMMPGRVGLVAVDSLAMGLPIVTTDYPFHAPEFEYLTPGSDCMVAPDDIAAFARAVMDLCVDQSEVARLQKGARSKAGWPSLEDMSQNFTQGCLRLFEH